MKKLSLIVAFCLCLIGQAFSADIARLHNFVDGEVLTAALLNNELNNIINEANDLDGDNLASNIAITSSGTQTFTGTFNMTGATATLGTAGSTLNLDPATIEYTEATTWGFLYGQTISGTWTNLGTVTTVDINGGTIDGVTFGATSAPTVTNIDINGGSIDGVTIGAAAAPTVTNLGTVTTCDINGGTMDGVQIGGTTATGEIIVNDASDDADGLGSQGVSGQFLQSQGAGSNPTWANDNNNSNVIFEWYGSDGGTTNVFGWVSGTSLTPDMNAAYTLTYNFYGVHGYTYRTILTGKFKKIAGISTVTIQARLWANGTEARLNVDIGGASNYVSTTSTTPVGVDSANIDVSGLTNGTVYDITIQLKNTNNDNNGFCSAVILIAS